MGSPQQKTCASSATTLNAAAVFLRDIMRFLFLQQTDTAPLKFKQRNSDDALSKFHFLSLSQPVLSKNQFTRSRQSRSLSQIEISMPGTVLTKTVDFQLWINQFITSLCNFATHCAESRSA